MHIGKLSKLFDKRRAFLLGNEFRSAHGVDQKLKLGKLKIQGHNAGGGNGAEVFYHYKGGKSKTLAENILDEIEAALDEVNVFRCGEYIKKFGDGTQFILITHRRGTMEIGDRLYGVTMPQRGISQAIELNVNEIEGKQKELLDGVL